MTADYLAERQAAFGDKLGRSINLFLCPQERYAARQSRLEFYFAPIFSTLKQRSYAAAAGQARITAFEACMARHPDLVFVHRLYGAAPVLRAVRERRVPVLMDLDEVEHRWFYRSIGEPPRWPLKRLFYLHLPAMVLYELSTIRRMTRTYVASPHDARYLTRLGCKNVVSIPNVVPSPAVVPAPAQEPLALFVGSFRYQPNVTAANILLREIWPRIIAAVPAARLVLAGENPENLDLPGQRSGIELPGFVDDIGALYARARVVCCPIFTGGGTRLKLIEAAAYARAIVSTPVGAEGIAFKDNESALLCSSTDALARNCIDLLLNPARAANIGAAARAMFLRDHDRVALVDQLGKSFRDLVDARQAPTQDNRI
ncbi:MAG: glycosyltransferase family 4 protein [Candidatus Accumulibacter sp.]|nr:glycosyltransferase family 4 protein [Accumulibacter sp.]